MLSGALFVVLISAAFAKDTTIAHEAHKAVIQQKFRVYGLQCLPGNPLTVQDIIAFKQKHFPKGKNAPCFMACVQRKLGILDDRGRYIYKEVLAITKKSFSKEEQKNFTEFLTGCEKVNEVKVNDGAKGCERAKLAYNCLIERAPKYDWDVDI